jgi:hypothetical protein
MTELPDRLLRDALRPGAPATTSSGCADADALAAWADGTLSSADRTAFEIHAADCARCQALMAAMVVSEPPPVEPAWWRRAVFSWLMPLAAATAALVVVVSLALNQRRTPASPLANNVAIDDSRAATPSRAEEKAAPKPTAPPAPTPEAPRARASTTAELRRERVDTIAHAPRPQDEPKGAASLSAAKTEQRAADTAPAAAPRAAQAPPASPASAAAGAASADQAARPPAAAAEASANAVGTRSFRTSDVDGRRMKAVTAPLLIASPDGESRWRIVDDKIEHTTDGGSTWRARPLDTATPVRAGAAPAARICWLAGVRGLVLLTTDGDTWIRVGLPEPVDLVAIEATDELHATVTTATGRRFRTSDGGKTWTQQ